MAALTAPPRSSTDRTMRRLLRVSGEAQPGAVFDAQNKLRSSIVISGIRCIITYLLVPVVAPIVALTGAIALPLSISLSVLALAMSHNSLRRFWLADHRLRWQYTAFVGAMWVLLLVGIGIDLTALVA